MAPELGEYAFSLLNPEGKTDFRTETFLNNLLKSQDINVVRNYKSAVVGRVRRMKLLDAWLHEYVKVEVYNSSSGFDSRTGMIRVVREFGGPFTHFRRLRKGIAASDDIRLSNQRERGAWELSHPDPQNPIPLVEVSILARQYADGVYRPIALHTEARRIVNSEHIHWAGCYYILISTPSYSDDQIQDKIIHSIQLEYGTYEARAIQRCAELQQMNI